MKIFKDIIFNSDVAVNCDTIEKAKNFLEYLHSKDIKWINGGLAINYTNWDIYKEKTTYTIKNNTLSYSDINNNDDKQILSYDDVIVENNDEKYFICSVGSILSKNYIYDSLIEAENKAKELAKEDVGTNFYVLKIAKTYKSKIIIDEY